VSAPIIAFFNPAGGVGKTTLVYHLAWMFSDLGLHVLAADLDPQANLTAAFFGEEALGDNDHTIYTSVEPMILGQGEVREAETRDVPKGISLLVGDLRFSMFEDSLAAEWSGSMPGQRGGLDVTTSLWRILTLAAARSSADVVLVDLGSNLGAINRAVLLAANYLLVPLKVGLISSHRALHTLGRKLRDWKNQWTQIREAAPDSAVYPTWNIQPIGYVIQERALRLNQKWWPYQVWGDQIPSEFRREVLGIDLKEQEAFEPRLAVLKHYHNLMYMALDAHKPMFHLRVADGASDSQLQAAQSVEQEYKRLAERIAKEVGLKLPYLSGSVA
jgi:chromosome partitioning protein